MRFVLAVRELMQAFSTVFSNWIGYWNRVRHPSLPMLRICRPKCFLTIAVRVQALESPPPRVEPQEAKAEACTEAEGSEHRRKASTEPCIETLKARVQALESSSPRVEP